LSFSISVSATGTAVGFFADSDESFELPLASLVGGVLVLSVDLAGTILALFEAVPLAGGIVVGLTVLARVGEAGWAAAALALEEAVPCINLDAELGTVVRTILGGVDFGTSLVRLCLWLELRPNWRLCRLSLASFALARLEAVCLEGVPVIWGRRGVGEIEEDPGVVDEGRFNGPVLEGVSLEAVPRENEDGAGRGVLVEDGRGFFLVVDGRGTEVLEAGEAALTVARGLAGVLALGIGGLVVDTALLVFSSGAIVSEGIDFGCGLTAWGMREEPEVVLVRTEEVELGCLVADGVGILLGVVALAVDAFGLWGATALGFTVAVVFLAFGLSTPNWPVDLLTFGLSTPTWPVDFLVVGDWGVGFVDCSTTLTAGVAGSAFLPRPFSSVTSFPPAWSSLVDLTISSPLTFFESSISKSFNSSIPSSPDFSNAPLSTLGDGFAE
jgi:hypothetical protein